LPADSLSKEIRLTQDLLELFMVYQIPSDLLTYDGPFDANTASKLKTVKQYAQKMQDMIKAAKQLELQKLQQVVDFDHSDEEDETPLAIEPEYGGGASRRRGARLAPTKKAPMKRSRVVQKKGKAMSVETKSEQKVSEPTATNAVLTGVCCFGYEDEGSTDNE